MAAGVASIIVLDVGRVGRGVGIDVDLMPAVRKAAPGVALFAGGGVRNTSDLDVLAASGCDGALVATALLEGRIRLTRSSNLTEPSAGTMAIPRSARDDGYTRRRNVAD